MSASAAQRITASVPRVPPAGRVVESRLSRHGHEIVAGANAADPARSVRPVLVARWYLDPNGRLVCRWTIRRRKWSARCGQRYGLVPSSQPFILDRVVIYRADEDKSDEGNRRSGSRLAGGAAGGFRARRGAPWKSTATATWDAPTNALRACGSALRPIAYEGFGAMAGMTKLLEKAIERVRELSAEDQDAVAVAVLSMAEETPVVALDDETRTAIREGLEQARRGEFVPDEEIDALWKRHGL